ncbi:hypothetical protein [Hylemonella gracilis]|uniref:hypothetical protein n=1 Tax=Hylemonella gracilis TaxID=80880 RepID=UPI0012DE18A9|nr:hypothetical protein [Hylemonella gracilis]
MKKFLYATIFTLSFVANSTERTSWKIDASVLSCQPENVHLGESIKLRLGLDHGEELSVVRVRDKVTFFLVVWGPPKGYQMLMSPQKFAEAKLLEISTEQEAIPWRPPLSPGTVRIFDQPGTYWFYTSVNLESEAGGHRCKVQVLPREK